MNNASNNEGNEFLSVLFFFLTYFKKTYLKFSWLHVRQFGTHALKFVFINNFDCDQKLTYLVVVRELSFFRSWRSG